jgi:hypothetical protein
MGRTSAEPSDMGAAPTGADRLIRGADLFVPIPGRLSDWLDGYPRFSQTLAWTTPLLQPLIPAR